MMTFRRLLQFLDQSSVRESIEDLSDYDNEKPKVLTKNIFLTW